MPALHCLWAMATIALCSQQAASPSLSHGEEEGVERRDLRHEGRRRQREGQGGEDLEFFDGCCRVTPLLSINRRE